jgi:hypothetical protein
MILPPGVSGAAFTTAEDGDQRHDPQARSSISRRLDIPATWATLRQAHHNRVIEAGSAGELGEADALFTSVPRLPLAVFTADCFGAVLRAGSAVGVAHAGWRGIAAGVLERLREEMTAAGHPPSLAAVGPGIGGCCFEVGPEVEARFPLHRSRTRWGTPSVDLRAAAQSQLSGMEVWFLPACTYHDPGHFSHRRLKAVERMATIGWVP